MHRYYFPYLLLLFTLLACADQNGQQVIIDRIEPVQWIAGETVQIVGSGFGDYTAAPEESTEAATNVEIAVHGLYLDGKLMDSLHWSDDRIVFSVPEEALGATYIMVWNNKHASNAYPVYISEPPEDEPVPATVPNESE